LSGGDALSFDICLRGGDVLGVVFTGDAATGDTFFGSTA
jgi:hypothetical protein